MPSLFFLFAFLLCLALFDLFVPLAVGVAYKFIFTLLLQFKRDPHKMVNITDCTVVLLDDPRHPDTFQLTDDTRGKFYHNRYSCT